MPYVVFVLFLSFIIGLLIIESLLLLEILIFIVFKFINLLLLLSLLSLSEWILLLFEIQSLLIFLQLLVSLFSSSRLWNDLVDIRLSVLDVVVLLLNIKLFLKEKDEDLSPFVLLLFLIFLLLWCVFQLYFDFKLKVLNILLLYLITFLLEKFGFWIAIFSPLLYLLFK